MSIRFTKNPTIKKKNYKDLKEYVFDLKTNVVPDKNTNLICIIFSENKGCYFLKRQMNMNREFDYFHFRKGMYIIENEAIHITANGVRIAFYLEGVSTPIKMSNIEKEILTVEYTDLYGEKQKSTIQKIKGLKFDAKILDIFANRRFAEIFTKQPINNFQFYLLILNIVAVIMIGIGYGVTYAFR